MNTDFHGIFPYLVSPVNPDGSIREESLRRLTEHLIACGVHGLTPLGSTGEFFYLSWEQKREIVRIVLDQAAGRVPVVAGVGCSSVRESAAQAAELERMGVDGILSILNVYFPLSQQSVYQYFAETARAVPGSDTGTSAWGAGTTSAGGADSGPRSGSCSKRKGQSGRSSGMTRRHTRSKTSLSQGGRRGASGEQGR